jgi:SET and MYND domain-containing protein
MHLLEMAKTAWNAIVTGDYETQVSEERLKNELRAYLSRCQEILRIFGREGDTTRGPLEEIQTLHGLLESG